MSAESLPAAHRGFTRAELVQIARNGFKVALLPDDAKRALADRGRPHRRRRLATAGTCLPAPQRRSLQAVPPQSE
jgi:hypothetical protein